LELLQAVLPEMRQRGFGRILTIGSVNQTSPEGLLSVYAAPKSAQYNLSINLAREYAPYGITVNNLSPGLIATERNKFRRQMLRHGRRSRPAVARCKRAGRASEMAAAVLLLCSDAGSLYHRSRLAGDRRTYLAW